MPKPEFDMLSQGLVTQMCYQDALGRDPDPLHSGVPVTQHLYTELE